MVSITVGVGHVPMMQVLLYVGLIIGFFRGGFVSRTSEKLGFLNMLGASESTEVIHSVFWGMCARILHWIVTLISGNDCCSLIWKRRGIVFLRGYDNAFRFDIVWLEFEI